MRIGRLTRERWLCIELRICAYVQWDICLARTWCTAWVTANQPISPVFPFAKNMDVIKGFENLLVLWLCKTRPSRPSHERSSTCCRPRVAFSCQLHSHHEYCTRRRCSISRNQHIGHRIPDPVLFISSSNLVSSPFFHFTHPLPLPQGFYSYFFASYHHRHHHHRLSLLLAHLCQAGAAQTQSPPR